MEKNNPASGSERSEQWLKDIYLQEFVGLKILAVRIMHNEIAADEILGQCFAVLATELRSQPDKFASTSNAKAYLVTIIRNQCCSWLRKKRPVTVSEPEEMIIDEHFLVQELEKRDMMQHLLSLIDLLPPKLRQVAALLYKDGLTYEEVAHQLQLDKQALYVYRNRAFSKLREMALARRYSERTDQNRPARVVNFNNGKLGDKAAGNSF